MVAMQINGLEVMIEAQAVAQAHRCLMCRDAPCTAACPANVDVMRFIRAIRFENPGYALDIIERSNVLAGICGVVCPKERLCEGACLRNALKDPIPIGALQTYVAARALSTQRPPSSPPPPPRGPKVAVVGAGPAGISAASTLVRAGAQVTIFDSREAPGGMLAFGVPQHRMPYEYVRAEIARALHGTTFLGGYTLGRNLFISDLFSQGFRAIFLAVGLWRPLTLSNVSDVEGVLHALPFLEAAARHAKFGGPAPKVGERCLIIGGGSVAMDCAEVARRYGAQEIEMVCLENSNEMPATWEEITEALRLGVRILGRRRVASVKRLQDGTYAVRTVGIRWRKPGLYTPENAEDVPEVTGETRVDTIIVAIGQAIDPDLDNALSDLNRDPKGLLIVDKETMETSVKGVYAGGDCASGCGRTVVAAVAEGRRAAKAILKALSEER